MATAAAFAASPVPSTIPVSDQPYAGLLTLAVDATDLDRKVFHAVETLPVKPGALTLYYPQWLPGTHSLSAQVARLAGLQIVAGNGQRVDWTRDTLDMHAFHLVVPRGVDKLTLSFDYLSPLETGGGRITATPDIVGVQWDTVVPYPAGHAASRIQIEPSVVLPAGWSHGSALELAARQADTLKFKPVSVEMLVDSPPVATTSWSTSTPVPRRPAARRCGCIWWPTMPSRWPPPRPSSSPCTARWSRRPTSCSARATSRTTTSSSR